MRIADIMQSKGTAVLTVAHAATVRQAVTDLTQHNVGALVVVEGEDVLGIFSERDVVRALAEQGPQALHAPLSDFMTSGVHTCSPEDSVFRTASRMTKRRIRHLPVVEDGALRGIVSIGDVVKNRIDELQEERDHLESYIRSG